jgi:mono/diheme cytochrome c family protein
LTEIPEHLLERSRARRAALGLGGGDAPAAKPAGDTPAVASSAALAKAAAAAPVVAAKKPEVVQSPEVRAANARKKVPWWAAPVLLFLPLWGFLYVQTLTPPAAHAAGLFAEGEEIYAKCAGCHGASGGGAGAIPGFTNGTLLATFPDFAHHVEWVARGSDGFKSIGTYGATNRPVAGGMPGWAGQLTAKQLLAVVYYERIHFGGQTEEELAQLEAFAENVALPANFEPTLNLDDIQALLAELAPEAG